MDLAESSAIPGTKLLPPQLPQEVLRRPGLVAELHQAVTSKRLTLLSAPAGAGKTTAVLELHADYPELPMAWLGLDEGDEDAHYFLRLLVASIRRLAPDCGAQIEELLASNAQSSFPPLQLAGALVNELLAHIHVPFVIVLDDLHRVNSTEIHELLNFLLERAPGNLHFVVTSRHDPPLRLGQLRSRDEMAEFRLERLRLSQAEISELLNQVMGFSVPADEIKLVLERTEGWAAGVKLLTLSLRQLGSAGQRSDLIHNLSASQRLLFDYLVEEVLQHLDEERRTFLLQTSILEELTPAACNAVTQRTDSAAVLDALYRQNLFLSISEAIDPLAPPSYRYHALFARFLQKQLGQWADLDLAELHRRAAKAETKPDRRIVHLIAGEVWDEAAEDLIALGKRQINRTFISQNTVNWIERLPESIRERYYWLEMIQASHANQKGLVQKARELSTRALAEAKKAGDAAGIIEGLFNQAFYGSDPEALQRLDEAVAAHPGVLSAARAGHYLLGKAWRALGDLRWDVVEEMIPRFLELARKEKSMDLYYTASQHIGPTWFCAKGGIEQISKFDAEVLRLVGEDGEGVLQTGPFARKAWLAFLRGDTHAAGAYAEKAKRGIQAVGGFAYLDVTIDYMFMNLMIVNGEYEQLREFLEERELRLRNVDTHSRSLSAYRFSFWRSYWLQDRFDEAREMMEQVLAPMDEEDQRYSPRGPLMKGWQDFVEGRPDQAEQELREAIRRQRPMRWVGTWGNPGVDLALFYFLLGDRRQSLSAWNDVAGEMEKQGMPGQALITGRKIISLLELAVSANEHAQTATKILEAFGQGLKPRPIPIPNSSESLTPREGEVLRLVMGGASNKEIAERLVITQRTAKAHVSNILLKLQVSSRAEAIARAHELSLF